MTVNSVSSTYGMSSVDPLLAPQSQGQVDPSSVTGGGGPTISDLASTLQSLQQLQQSDPEKFKEVMASISSTLQTDASNASGPQAQFLGQLASKFQQAAQTGSMSSLQPPGSVSGHHGHHHRHHAVQSYGANQPSNGGGAQQTPFDLSQIIQNAMQEVGT